MFKCWVEIDRVYIGDGVRSMDVRGRDVSIICLSYELFWGCLCEL